MNSAILGKFTRLSAVVSPFIALAGIVVLQAQEYKKSVRQLNRADYLAQEQQQEKLVNWQQNSPSLGFDNLKASWSYLDFVQYFGDRDARDTIGYKLVPEYFETLTTLDPRFTKAYLGLSVANSMYAGNPETTVALMEEVLDFVDPTSEQAAYLWTFKGLDELLFMGDKEAAIASYKMAAQWSELQPEFRPDGLTIRDLEAGLQNTTEIDLKEAQVRAWSSVLTHIRDSQKQREILAKITRLKAEISELKMANNVQP
ncbi:MAG: hypothetical protein AAFO95_22540 [Cyanobacteria bacterium J06600_6]